VLVIVVVAGAASVDSEVTKVVVWVIAVEVELTVVAKIVVVEK